ncbi:MAG: insulinase family protein [Mycoplasmatales bacterium]
MQKINHKVYYLNNELKTINTIKKTIILEKKSKYDSLDFSILLDTLTNRIKKYNKLEFKKIKALNYNVDFKVNYKELEQNILINITVEFLSLEYLSNNSPIIALIKDIFTGLYLTKEDLELTIIDYRNLYQQIKDINDQYIKYLLKDEVYQDDVNMSTYQENEQYLVRLKTSELLNKIELLNSDNYFYIIESSQTTLEIIKPHFITNEVALQVYSTKVMQISNEFKKLELFKNQNQVSIAMTYQGLINKEHDEYILRLLNMILGRTAFSLLFKNVREKESLCYSIYSQEELNYGINIYTGVEYQNYEQAIKLIDKQFTKLKSGDIKEEFNKAQAKYLSDLQQESTKLLTQEILLYKNLIYQTTEYEITKIITRVQAITIEDIQILAQKLNLTKIVLKN